MELKNKLISLFLTGVLSISGCLMRMNKKIETKGPIYPEVGLRVGAEIINYDVKKIGKKIQTTGVHPDDSGFLYGKTTTNVYGSETDFAPKLGLEASIGTDFLRLYGGIDGRIHSLSGKGYGEGLCDSKQQISDNRHPSQGSFVFTQIDPDSFSWVPFVGIEGVLFNKIHAGVEVGFPNYGFTAKSGHDRWGKWQTVQKDHWRGFGKKIGGFIGISLEEFPNESELHDRFLGFYMGKETYGPTFAGEKAEIESRVYMLQIRGNF